MDSIIQRILDLAISIQQIPAPSFHETERAGFVRARFEEEKLEGVEIDSAGNVYACFCSSRQPPAAREGPVENPQGKPFDKPQDKPFDKPQDKPFDKPNDKPFDKPNDKPLIVSAHLDTVFPLGVDLSVRREPEGIFGPGIGDNSLGLAGLFGLVWTLRERGLSLPGDLWLVANVCEEGLGNLRGIKAVVDRFEPPPERPARLPGAQAYIILEGMALGQVYQRGLGVSRYRISIRTAGGHSWIDYGQPSAVHELAALSTRITTLELPRSPRTTLNVGIISGGSSVNTIAAEAMLELDLRSENADGLEKVIRQVEQIVHSAHKPGVEIELESIGRRPSGEIPADHRLVKLAQDCLREVGLEPHLNIGSTDANLPLSLGLPAITIGLTTGGRAHTVHEFINLPPLEKGLEQLVRLVSRAWD